MFNKKIILFITFILVLIFFLVCFTPYYLLLSQTLKISLVKTILNIDKPTTFNNQMNIVVLGIAGGEHDGPNLSDSIIVFNYNFSNNQLTSISVPRDIWSDTLKDKINSAYAYGEAKQKGGGLKLAKAEISYVVGLPIQYGIVINFEKFKQVIDYSGGIDVLVENSFSDSQYPIEGMENDLCNGDPTFSCRYQTITFIKGMTHMNGDMALKFVRSRHAINNEEGSDFAREKRQQAVITAIKSKLQQKFQSNNLKKIEQLYSVINNSLERDITNQQTVNIIKNILIKGNFKQKSLVLNENIFEVPAYYLYDNKYVLIPPNNDFQPIYNYVNCIIENTTKCTEPKINIL